jgi:hypothetical protein
MFPYRASRVPPQGIKCAATGHHVCHHRTSRVPLPDFCIEKMIETTRNIRQDIRCPGKNSTPLTPNPTKRKQLDITTIQNHKKLREGGITARTSEDFKQYLDFSF